MRRGVALVMVMFLLTFLVVVVYQFVMTVRVDRRLARNTVAQRINYYACRGALNLARAYIEKDGKENTLDTLNDCWATGEQLEDLKIGDATVEMRIVDAESLFNLANLSKQTNKFYSRTKNGLSRLVSYLGLEEDDPDNQTIAPAVTDWIDQDKKGDYEDGAENRVPRVLEELMLVPEVTERVYYGWIDTEAEQEYKGLREFLTLWGSGRININTAPKEVLVAMSGAIDEEKADNIIEYRQEESFKTPNDLVKVSGCADVFNRDRTLRAALTTVSTFFQVRIRSEANGCVMRVRAIVRRLPGATETVVWKEEER